MTEFILKCQEWTEYCTEQQFDDNVFSALLFKEIPAWWESVMHICEIFPPREMKCNMKSHVTKKLAQERFALFRGTPESKETQNGRAIVSAASVSNAQVLAGVSTGGRRMLTIQPYNGYVPSVGEGHVDG